MDFSAPKAVGEDMESDFSALHAARGFDHCYCFDGADGALLHRATLSHPPSGREMRLYTTQPTVHFYTANFCNKDLLMKGGYRQRPHLGLCLETQKMPDSVHHSHFTNTVLLPGEKYDHTTEYRFSVIK
jgi:aldose 1-epimerase